MCGIIAAFGSTTVERTIDQYGKQWTRGNEGFGFIALKHDRLISWGRATTEREIEVMLADAKALGPDGLLFHHRFPTSTINVEAAAHPLPINKKGWKHRYWMLHNGVVSGQDEEAIKKDGYRFQSRVTEVKYYQTGTGKNKKTYTVPVDSEVNDSEYLGYYVASLLEGAREDIPMSGAIACLMLAQNKKTNVCTLYAMRNTMNPLKVHRTKVKGAHDNVLMSSEGLGENLEPGTIFRFDFVTRSFVVHQEVSIGKSYASSYAGLNSSFWDGDPHSIMGFSSSRKDDKGTVLITQAEALKADAAVMGRELERLTLAADQAYADYAEARETFGDDDTIEAKAYIAEYERKSEEAEEARDALMEETLSVDPMMKF